MGKMETKVGHFPLLVQSISLLFTDKLISKVLLSVLQLLNLINGRKFLPASKTPVYR